MEKPTHIATNRNNGEVCKVWFNPLTKQYQESFMVCLRDVDRDWIIKPITQE